MLTTEPQRTLVDGPGLLPRGLQNRLRGAAEASLVGSIPIHPRHVLPAMTAKMTATAAHSHARQESSYGRFACGTRPICATALGAWVARAVLHAGVALLKHQLVVGRQPG